MVIKHHSTSCSRFLLYALASIVAVESGCGGGSSSSGPQPNPVPAIATINPTTAVRGGPSFTLTVNGSNFLATSIVQWNGNARTTSFVSPTQLTTQISADDISVAGTDNISVLNAAPGGGISGAVPFKIPCVLAPASPASSQTRARLGAYYFDGWAGPLTSYHLSQIVNGSYQNLQPLSGWRDDNQCAVEQQLAWAHSFGLNFFVYLWYYKAEVSSPTENLNSALQITHSLPDRHGMQFAILNGDPFIIGPADWTSAIPEWVGYMKDPAYLLVNGKPYFGVIDMRAMRQTFGSSSAVANALNQVRTAAQAAGLPGVYMVGGMFVTDAAPSQDGLFPDLSMVVADGYDAVTTYNYPFASPLGISGAQPFSTLASVGMWTWTQAGLKSPVSIIPVAMDGWDTRDESNSAEPGRPLFWFERQPQDVATFIDEIIAIAESNPQVRPESSLTPPLVLIEAWNELLEGSILIPTVGDGTSFGDTLSTMLATPPPKVRGVLTLNDSGPSDPNRAATGKLTDANGAPIVGATISLTYSPANGAYNQYQLPGQAPPDAAQAIVAFRVNSDDPTVLWPGYWFAGPGTSSFSVYQASYVQPSDGIERIPNHDFSQGSQSWTLQGQTQLVPSDRGAGQMIKVVATPSQVATLDSRPFPVTPGANFLLSFSATIPASSSSSGYFLVAFQDASGNVLDIPGTSAGALKHETIAFTAAQLTFGTATADANGNYQLNLTSLGTSQAILEATYAGDSQHWPAYARVGSVTVVWTAAPRL